MKRIIIILILLLGGLAARAENVVSVSSASGHPQDEVTLNVSLANTDAAVAFQVEIPLGSQLTYVAGSVTFHPERITDHQVSAAVVGGSLCVYAYSLSLTPFVGNSGDLLSFTLRLKNEPGDYTLDMGSAKLSDASGTALPVGTSNGAVTILSPKLQINTPSIDFGHVPIHSEYTQNASVTNVGNEPLTLTNITFSDAVFSCPGFTETTLQPGNSANFYFKFSPMVKGVVTATSTITSNSISGNGIIQLLADPFAVNEIHIDYVTGYCDSIVEVPISMNNMEDIMGFQIDMNLPEALEYLDFTLSDRKADHVAMGVFNEGLLRLMAYSSSNAAFAGDEGLIGTVRFRLHGMYGNYYLNPTKAVLADANGEDVLSDKYQGYVSIRSPKINGGNALSFGASPVTETVTKEYVVRNNGNASMRIDQVVFDQLDFTIAETTPIVVEQGASTTLHVSYNRKQAGDFNALMKIYSNDPENGLKTVNLSGSRFEPNNIALSVDPFNLGGGDVDVALKLNNYSGIVALQADFQYPYQDYSMAASDFALTERFANHSLYALPLNDSTYRIIVISMQNQAVDGHNGNVLNVTLHPIATPAEEEYTVSVANVVLSGVEGVNLYSGDDMSSSFNLTMMQSVLSLGEGWNWCSASVLANNLLEQVEQCLGINGVKIMTQSGAVVYSDGSWMGDLDGLEVEQMYKIQTTAPCEIMLQGMRANTAQCLITLAPGLNWIGFPCGTSLPVISAMSNLTPTLGDKIVSQNDGFSIYEDNTWNGTLESLRSGQGYYYISNALGNKTFSYNIPNFAITATVNPNSGGSVTGCGNYDYGQVCTLTASANSGFEFTDWTENGSVVSNDASYAFTVSANRFFVANFIANVSPQAPTGAVDGLFSVNESKQIYFSQGNLQYQASNNVWRFAEHQWDYVGDAEQGTVIENDLKSNNELLSSSYDGWIDLFGWGTSGYNHGAVCYQPWSISTSTADYKVYGNATYNLFDKTGQADWGYNAISNGGNTENTWRTLTHEEWAFLFNSRSTSSGIRFAKAQVNGVDGVILLPDDWEENYYTLNNTNNSGASYSSNVINSDAWASLESHGAVFLPHAGRRSGVVMNEMNCGYYWASDRVSSIGWSWYTRFSDTVLTTEFGGRSDGFSVRLVQDY